jgi:hypothetical protein
MTEIETKVKERKVRGQYCGILGGTEGRGKCKEMAEKAVKNNPNLILVRGWYYEPLWNKDEEHWWTKDKNTGEIFDPTAAQFPSGGIKELYTEFDNKISCSECGKMMTEETMQMCGRYPVCSTKCAMRLVGL